MFCHTNAPDVCPPVAMFVTPDNVLVALSLAV